MYTYIQLYHIYIYIYRERERERDAREGPSKIMSAPTSQSPICIILSWH